MAQQWTSRSRQRQLHGPCQVRRHRWRPDSSQYSLDLLWRMWIPVFFKCFFSDWYLGFICWSSGSSYEDFVSRAGLWSYRLQWLVRHPTLWSGLLTKTFPSCDTCWSHELGVYGGYKAVGWSKVYVPSRECDSDHRQCPLPLNPCGSNETIVRIERLGAWWRFRISAWGMQTPTSLDIRADSYQDSPRILAGTSMGFYCQRRYIW